jgi:hypothetical protein
MPFRLLVRAAPLVLGAVAAAIWLRRRQPERPALRPGPALPARSEPEPGSPSEPAPRARTGRFDRRPVDIVTIVDDLLESGR